MNEIEVPIEPIEQIRVVPETPGRNLESAVSIIGERTFLVLVYRVDYGQQMTFSKSTAVVKFAESQYAIPNSSNFRLASAKYYREYEEAPDPQPGSSRLRNGSSQRHRRDETNVVGIADPEEGQFLETLQLDEFCRKYGVASRTDFEHVTTSVTWGVPDFWMFCTSSMPDTSWDFQKLQARFPRYDSATIIADPSRFAVQIGKDFGRSFSEDDLRIHGLDALKQLVLRMNSRVSLYSDSAGKYIVEPRRFGTVVRVTHGPVFYTDHPAHLLDRLSLVERGNVVPFVKRKKFEGDQEYRFLVEPIGEPMKQEFFMPISDQIRSLAKPYSE